MRNYLFESSVFFIKEKAHRGVLFVNGLLGAFLFYVTIELYNAGLILSKILPLLSTVFFSVETVKSRIFF